MPVTKRLPYQWYDTPNIRVGTFKDFEVLATKNRLAILDATACRKAARCGSCPMPGPARRSSSSSAAERARGRIVVAFGHRENSLPVFTDRRCPVQALAASPWSFTVDTASHFHFS